MILQLAFVLTAIIIGARLGGIGLGVMGGVGLAILTFVFGLLTNYKIYLPVIQLIKSDYIIMDNAKVTNIKTI